MESWRNEKVVEKIFTKIRKLITKLLVNFKVNKCKNFETFKTF